MCISTLNLNFLGGVDKCIANIHFETPSQIYTNLRDFETPNLITIHTQGLAILIAVRISNDTTT